ncbi:MAG: pyridoxal phosphate-dependent aminotransferase [Anaeromyxobacteraceae bacterium]
MQIVTPEIRKQMEGASWIRRMFDAGLELKARVGAENVCDFSLGNPDLPPPGAVAQAMKAIAERAVQPMGLGYCPNAGLPSVRAALAKKLAREQQAPVEARHLLLTCGAAGGLVTFFRAVLEAGDEVLCVAPYFVEYGAYAGHFGATLKAVSSKGPDFAPDLAALEAAIGPRTRALLIDSPNNPTGCIYDAATLRAIGDLLARVNAGRERPVFLVSDEPYRALAYDGAVVPPVLPVSPFAVVIGSFSKSLSLAGERVGYVVASPAMPDVQVLIDALTMTNRTLGFVNAPVVGQQLVEALIDASVDVGVYDRRRKAMAAALTGAGIEFYLPKGAFYFFPKAPGGDDQAFVNLLLEENILAVPGRGFGMPGYFRLTFCVDEKVIERSAPGFKRAVARVLPSPLPGERAG